MAKNSHASYRYFKKKIKTIIEFNTDHRLRILYFRKNKKVFIFISFN